MVECLPRWSSAREERAGVSRPPPGRVSIRSLALATRPTKKRLGGRVPASFLGGRVPARNERVYRDHHPAGSRYARWRSLLDQRKSASVVECPRGTSGCIETTTRPGLDTLAGARYSTNEKAPRWSSARELPRWSSAREERAGVSRPPPGRVSIRSLALATRPTKKRLGGRVPASFLGGRVPARNERAYRDHHPAAGSRYARWRSLLDQRKSASVVECPRGTSGCIETTTRPGQPGLDTLAGARYSTNERRLGGRVPARNERAYRDHHPAGSRYARWRSLLDQRKSASVVECPRGTSGCTETTLPRPARPPRASGLPSRGLRRRACRRPAPRGCGGGRRRSGRARSSRRR